MVRMPSPSGRTAACTSPIPPISVSARWPPTAPAPPSPASASPGLAAQAQLYAPDAVALGPDGSLYIADSGNHRVREVGPDGTITTVAGNGFSGFEGSPGGDGGPATQAALWAPDGLALGPDGSLD